MKRKDINIYEILKGVEYGTELYTPMCGKVVFTYLSSSNGIIRTEKDSGIYCFDKNGRWREGGEVMLFPSKEMRDWAKFSWKKGDVLANGEGDYCVFKEFAHSSYQTSKAVFVKRNKESIHSGSCLLDTKDWHKASHSCTATYINTIEKELSGKLNMETLEIEKTQPFKDGDIVSLEIRYIDSEDVIVETYIVHGDYNNGENLNFYAGYRDNITDKVIYNSFVRPDKTSVRKELLRYATEEEKQQLFSALSKENKAWDANKKQIENLKPVFEVGKLYVFREEDEDGELTIIGKLIDKNESEDTLTFGNQYEIENEKFVGNQAFYLRISVHKELREATEGEAITFQEAYTLWEKKVKGQPDFKTFDKVLVRCKNCKWLPAFFVRDRGEDFAARFNALPIHSGHAGDFTSCIPFEGHENIAFTDYDIENLPF